jgi:hypothetical protein
MTEDDERNLLRVLGRIDRRVRAIGIMVGGAMSLAAAFAAIQIAEHNHFSEWVTGLAAVAAIAMVWYTFWHYFGDE